MENFDNLLYQFSDEKVSDSKISSIVDKVKNCLNSDEIEILESLSGLLTTAKVKQKYIDDYKYITSKDLNEIMKVMIWDNSDDWAKEMYSVSDGIMTNLTQLENDNFKKLIIAIKNKENLW